ncbi:MAG: AlpA family phage regulatory protein, partial [Alphaproteobacteria bacterium]
MKRVSSMTSLSRTMINRLRNEGKFPAKIDMGGRRVAFVKAEVLDWIHEKMESRK